MREHLISLKEENYKKFMEKLIPNTSNILGVRIPILKKLAKQIIKEDYNTFLYEEELYFEEVMIKGFIISYLKIDIEEKFKLIKWYLPKITNWSLCDSFCSSLKIKEEQLYFEFIQQFIDKGEYETRYVVVTILASFVKEDYIDKSFDIFDNIKSKDYYVSMAIAWAISKFFTKYKDKTLKYLNNNKLDTWTYNKALQKILETSNIDNDTKYLIKSMKKKQTN